MKIVIGADHGGFNLKNILIPFLKNSGHDILDIGIYNNQTADYPDISKDVAKKIISGEAERGILICGSGVGACIAANKLRGIRACVCHDIYTAHQGVEHDDMNVLCLGEKVIGTELAKELTMSFLSARLMDEERYLRRLKKVEEIERQQL